jgi:hypothetical protein
MNGVPLASSRISPGLIAPGCFGIANEMAKRIRSSTPASWAASWRRTTSLCARRSVTPRPSEHDLCGTSLVKSVAAVGVGLSHPRRRLGAAD